MNIDIPRKTNPKPIVNVEMMDMRNFASAGTVMAGDLTIVIAKDALYNMP
jgi:hypothetical protein